MTNYSERLNEILRSISTPDDWISDEAYTLSIGDAKQALTSLIKELVAEAKPDWHEHEKAAECFCFTEATEKFEQNLLKALEEV